MAGGGARVTAAISAVLVLPIVIDRATAADGPKSVPRSVTCTPPVVGDEAAGMTFVMTGPLYAMARLALTALVNPPDTANTSCSPDNAMFGIEQ